MPAILEEEHIKTQVEIIEEEIEVIAIELDHRLRGFDPNETTIAVTTFVDLDNLDVATSFGRFVAEELATDLHKLGYNIRELRQRKAIEVIHTKGELALTRRSGELMKRFQVDAVLTGTYMIVGEEIVVNARFIDVDSSRVISVGRMVADMKKLDRIPELLSRRHKGLTPVVKVINPDGG